MEMYKEYPEGLTHPAKRKRLRLPEPQKNIDVQVGRRKTKSHNCYWVSLKGNDSFNPILQYLRYYFISYVTCIHSSILTFRNKALNIPWTKPLHYGCAAEFRFICLIQTYELSQKEIVSVPAEERKY